MTALATLIPVSTICGVVGALVFRRFAAPGIGSTVNRMLAHVLELHLFLEEPRLVWKAQRSLMRENLKLLRHIAVPLLIMAPLFALVIWQGDRVYGRGALRPGRDVVVTAHTRSADLANLQLLAPSDVVVETPGVRIPRLGEVSWRIRPLRPIRGGLAVRGAPASIDIPWPPVSIFGMPWEVWLFVFSSLAGVIALRLRSPRPLLAVLLLAAPCARAAGKPPIILISIDTLRADHLSAYGYTKIRTPNLDSVAAHGTLYQRIDTQIPLTLPSHTTLMTSTYPFADRVEANDEMVPAGAVTLASVLRANGYRTAAFIGSIILDRRYGLDRGFDLYDSPFQAAPSQISNPYSARVRRDAALVTRAARQWMEENRSAPFFVFLHFYDLHTPYTLPAVAALTPSVAGYDTELEHVDQVFGRFHDALAKDGMWDGALVVLLADHGESLGDHGELSHGYFIYESTMHVPLLVHWPEGAAGDQARSSEPGGLVDVAPTILDFLHIPAPASFAGQSLLNGHRGTQVYGESVYPQENFGWGALRSLQSGGFKYISAPKPELYDLSRDAGERSNVIASHPAEVKLLETRLAELRAKYAPPARLSGPPLDAHTRQVLGSLGYTAGGGQGPHGRLPDPKDKLPEAEAYEKGLTLLYTGHFDQAILTLHRIVAQDARNLPALCALGEAYERSGKTARALACWQQALQRDPKYQPAAESIREACALPGSSSLPACSQR